MFNNKSATAAQTFVLPPAGGSGCRLTFTRWTGFPVTVQTNLREGPNDRINSQADAGGTVFGGSITANRPFAKITVIDEDTGNWVAESVSGGWISDTGVLMSTGGRVWLGSTSTAPYVFTNLPSGIGTFEMQCSGIVPVTDGIDMVVQISADNGATWKNAAGGYTTIASAEHTTATVTRRTTGVNGFLNVGAIDSAAANPFSLTAWFRDLGSATVNKVVDWQSSYNNNTPVYEEARGSVKYTADQAAINAVRVFPQTGGVSAGSCSIEAVIR